MITKPKYRFHDEKPNLYRSVADLTSTTQKNLIMLNAMLGIEFNNRAWIWKIRRPSRMFGVPDKFVDDIRILGNWKEHKIEYWRHETASAGAGQTYIYIDTKKWKEFSISDFQKWPDDLQLSNAIQNEDREMLLYIATHENPFVRKITESIIKTMGLEYNGKRT